MRFFLTSWSLPLPSLLYSPVKKTLDRRLEDAQEAEENANLETHVLKFIKIRLCMKGNIEGKDEESRQVRKNCCTFVRYGQVFRSCSC